MITKIGFKNFRRFKEYTEVDLGDINMFVGGNNAGKSTVVKALLLVANFLKNTTITTERDFNKYVFPLNVQTVNIDTFNRALCWNSDEEEILFHLEFYPFNLDIEIYNAGTKEDITAADIKKITLVHQEHDVIFDFNIAQGSETFLFGKQCRYDIDRDNNLVNIFLKKLKKEKESLEVQITELMTTNSPNSENLNKKLAQVANIKEEISLLEKEKNDNEAKGGKEDIITIPLSPFFHISRYNYITSFIRGAHEFTRADNPNYPKEMIAAQKKLKNHREVLRITAEEFDSAVNAINIEYLQAHDASQKVLFNKRDQNDYVSQSIHELVDTRISSNSQFGEIFKQWLHDFNIADDFFVASTVGSIKEDQKEFLIGEGEGYAFGLKVNDQWHNLGDMGRGSIQLVVLFIRLIILLKKYDGAKGKPIVLIEEPEQNLHPAVQSKLADLFCELKDKLCIITETHSEYLIRQTQLKVAQSIKNNGVSEEDINKKYKIYFFPTTGEPYSMGYQSNGRFEETFKDKGFFDEAGRIVRELTILERK